jgi:hypothetical protein
MGITQSGAVVAAVFTRGGSQLKVGGFAVEPGIKEPSSVLDDFVSPTTKLSWSHDGRRLAVASQNEFTRPLTPLFNDLQPLRLTIRDVEKGVPKTLPTTLEFVNDLEWEPADRFLIATGSDRRHGLGVFRIDAGTGETSPLVLTPGEQPTMEMRWGSVIGSRLYYQGNVIATQTARLAEHDLATRQEREILPWARRFDDGPPDPRPIRRVVGITPRGEVLYLTKPLPLGPSTLRQRSISGGEDRLLMEAPAGATLTLLDQTLGGQAALIARTTAAKQSEVFRVPLDGSGGAVKLTTTAEDLSTFRTFGVSSNDQIYLGKFAQPGVLGIWMITADGALTDLHITRDVVQSSVDVPMKISPDRARLAYITSYRPPPVPLEVKVFENLPVPRQTAR